MYKDTYELAYHPEGEENTNTGTRTEGMVGKHTHTGCLYGREGSNIMIYNNVIAFIKTFFLRYRITTKQLYAHARS